MTREEVIAHLLSRTVEPGLHYMGVPVDATWPAEALYAMATQLAVTSARQMESHLQSLSMMSAIGARR